jgi:hypothetical protein
MPCLFGWIAVCETWFCCLLGLRTSDLVRRKYCIYQIARWLKPKTTPQKTCLGQWKVCLSKSRMTPTQKSNICQKKKKNCTLNLIHVIHKARKILSTFTSQCHSLSVPTSFSHSLHGPFIVTFGEMCCHAIMNQLTGTHNKILCDALWLSITQSSGLPVWVLFAWNRNRPGTWNVLA